MNRLSNLYFSGCHESISGRSRGSVGSIPDDKKNGDPKEKEAKKFGNLGLEDERRTLTNEAEIHQEVENSTKKVENLAKEANGCLASLETLQINFKALIEKIKEEETPIRIALDQSSPDDERLADEHLQSVQCKEYLVRLITVNLPQQDQQLYATSKFKPHSLPKLSISNCPLICGQFFFPSPGTTFDKFKRLVFQLQSGFSSNLSPVTEKEVKSPKNSETPREEESMTGRLSEHGRDRSKLPRSVPLPIFQNSPDSPSSIQSFSASPLSALQLRQVEQEPELDADQSIGMVGTNYQLHSLLRKCSTAELMHLYNEYDTIIHLQVWREYYSRIQKREKKIKQLQRLRSLRIQTSSQLNIVTTLLTFLTQCLKTTTEKESTGSTYDMELTEMKTKLASVLALPSRSGTPTVSSPSELSHKDEPMLAAQQILERFLRALIELKSMQLRLLSFKSYQQKNQTELETTPPPMVPPVAGFAAAAVLHC